MEPHDSALGQPLRMAAHALDWGDSFNSQINRYKGSGGNEKLLRHRVPKVGIVRIVPSTPTQKSHKHRHHGGAVFPSYGMVSIDTPLRKGSGKGALTGFSIKR